jgi:hypothetical protein
MALITMMPVMAICRCQGYFTRAAHLLGEMLIQKNL